MFFSNSKSKNCLQNAFGFSLVIVSLSRTDYLTLNLKSLKACHFRSAFFTIKCHNYDGVQSGPV